jgi:hypothetical protein
MDPGFPGNFERIFQQYDRLSTKPDFEKSSEDPAPEAPDPPSPVFAKPRDDPPWFPDSVTNPEKSFGDIQAERMAAADQRINEHLTNPNGASFEQDEAGLTKAYQDPSGVSYDPATRTEYVRGTTTPRGVYDDFTKIPAWGNLQDSDRYQKADKSYYDLINSGKPVDRILGHSLGGSVALEMQGQHDIPKSRTFGAPVFDLFPKAGQDRYRHPLDPVSMLDRGANWGYLRMYPHSYTGFTA